MNQALINQHESGIYNTEPFITSNAKKKNKDIPGTCFGGL
jgi:hypothetical protein